MKAVFEHIYERGKRAMKYLRRRIPAELLSAYPKGHTHITRSLGTSDLPEAKRIARVEEARIEEEFERARTKLAAHRGRLLVGQRAPLRPAAAVRSMATYALEELQVVRPHGEKDQSSLAAGVLQLLQAGDAASALVALETLVARDAQTLTTIRSAPVQPGALAASVSEQDAAPRGSSGSPIWNAQA